MSKSALIGCMFLTAAAAARGGIVVELIPDLPAPNTDGSYNGGERFDVAVRLTSDTSIDVRLLQFDHTASSSQLALGRDIDIGLPVYEPTLENPFDGVPNFVFNYSSLADASGYTDFSNLNAGLERRPWPASTVFTNLNGRGASELLHIEAGVPFNAGVMPVTLPTAADTYVLDLLNSGTGNRNLGAIVVFGGMDGLPTTTWSSMDDGAVEISYLPDGGPAVFAVIPEPGAMLLLAVGTSALLGRSRTRRASRGPSV